MSLKCIVADSLFRCLAGAPEVEVSAEMTADTVLFTRFAVKLTRTVSWQLMAKKISQLCCFLASFPHDDIDLTLC